MSRAVAEYFGHVDRSRVEMLNILAPYEFKNKLTGWHRGSIKYSQFTAGAGQDLVVTGPKLRITFDGCRWNRIVFAMTNEQEVQVFRDWLVNLETQMETTINMNPTKYKINPSLGIARMESCIRTSVDQTFADDLRCRLSVRYEVDGENGSISDADLFMLDESGVKIPVDPSEVKAGSAMIPVFKISYQKMANTFYLVLTVLKGQIFPSHAMKVENEEWVMDYPMEVTN